MMKHLYLEMEIWRANRGSGDKIDSRQEFGITHISGWIDERRKRHSELAGETTIAHFGQTCTC